MGGQMAVEKSLNFMPSFKRLLSHLAPERWILVAVVALAVVGISLNVLGPRILGWATDVIFTGVIGKNLPAGMTKEQVVAQLRADGNSTMADLVQRLDVVPGQGIDFTALANLLMLALAIYVVASLFLWLQGYLLNGAVQRSIYTLRNQVEAKINRLPLSYFDRQTRGELLSRVTNDIDNVSQALQQTMSQLLTSLLTVIGVTVMMVVVSPVLAIIALVTIPVALGVTTVIGKRSQKLFISPVEGHRRAQRPRRGGLHRALAGQGVRPAARGAGRLRGQERHPLRVKLRCPVRLRDDHADHVLHRQSELRGHRGRRRAAGGQRDHEPG